MIEEIETAKKLLDEIAEAWENEDFESVSGKANIVKTLAESIELSGIASGLIENPDEDGEIEAWDPEEEYEEEEAEE